MKARLPLVVQTAATECGLACLTMIANYHGMHIDLRGLRERFDVSMRGATLGNLLRFAGDLGFASRPLRVELEDLPYLQTPCILHWDLEHFVVLHSVRRGRLLIHDPARGRQRLSVTAASRHFTGVALELTPTADFTPGGEVRSFGIRELSGRITGLGRCLSQLFATAAILELLMLVSPLFLQFALDRVVDAHRMSLLNIMGLAFAGIVLMQALLTGLRGWSALTLGTSLKLQWYANLFGHLVKLPVPFFEKRYFGDILSRFDGAEVVHRTLTNSFVETLLDGIISVFVLAVMAWYSVPLASVVLLSAALYVLLRHFSYNRMRGLTEEQLIRMARQQSFLIETLRGIRTIKVFAREEQRKSRWMNLVVDSMNAQIATEEISILLKSASACVFGLQSVAVIWYGTGRVLAGGMTIGMLFAFVAYQQLFTSRISALVDRGYELRMLSLQIQRLADIALEAPEQALPPAQASSHSADIRLRNLSFRYATTDPWLFRNIHVDIGAGECVAITGPSGAGKSTLLKLMAGLLQPQEGDVSVCGHSLRSGRAGLGGRLGFVLQDDSLFGGSIAENIALAADVPDMARVEECARLACLHADIARMPMGYNTQIGDMGGAISGGQQQRLLLARALYAEPSILILDEATSHLDIETEQAIAAMLAELKISRIFAAHRPETIAIASRIVDIRDLTEVREPDGANELGSFHDPKFSKGEVYVEQ